MTPWMKVVNNYDTCMKDVINEIEDNLEFVSIDELIRISGYSYFHFHRIFKTHTGESIKKYIKRLQLEKALRKMKEDKENITQLAIEAGFHMSSSFNKAFKEMFEITPTEYKKSYKELRKSYKDIEPIRIETIDSFEVYALRYVGECHYIYESFMKMLAFAQENSLIDDSFEMYGVTYDDPEVTDDVKLRYDVCVKDTKKIELSGEEGIYKKVIDGGKYAIFIHHGNPDNLIETYNSIFGKWLYNNNINLRYVPTLQKILNNINSASMDDFTIELYIPIE